nr:hypothetical protein Iba_chr08eCG5960 [Ipomoea batatas]
MIVDELNAKGCLPPVCEKVSMGDEEPSGAINVHDEGMEAEGIPVEVGLDNEKHGLEELALRGINVDQFVGEAVPEAAVNIIEEVAGKVMEGVDEVSEEDGSQEEDTQGEEDASSEEEESSQFVSYNTWVDNMKNKEGEESSSREVRKKNRVIRSTMEWVKVVEEYMEKDKDFEQKVKEALKEVNAYLWTVYDKEKEEYVEVIKIRVVRAVTIFLVKVELCSSWKNDKGLLERNLKANIDLIGARICPWAVAWDL